MVTSRRQTILMSSCLPERHQPHLLHLHQVPHQHPPQLTLKEVEAVVVGTIMLRLQEFLALLLALLLGELRVGDCSAAAVSRLVVLARETMRVLEAEILAGATSVGATSAAVDSVVQVGVLAEEVVEAAADADPVDSRGDKGALRDYFLTIQHRIS